jgi:1,4-alpha-glucan branching enzyme
MRFQKLKSSVTSRVTSPAAVRKPTAVAAKSNGIPLKIVAPGAKEVFVAGSFNNWHTAAIPLKSLPSGEWRGELKLPPGRYEYLFVVDGKWLPDPAAHEMAPNPFGGWNSVVSVS